MLPQNFDEKNRKAVCKGEPEVLQYRIIQNIQKFRSKSDPILSETLMIGKGAAGSMCHSKAQ